MPRKTKTTRCRAEIAQNWLKRARDRPEITKKSARWSKTDSRQAQDCSIRRQDGSKESWGGYEIDRKETRPYRKRYPITAQILIILFRLFLQPQCWLWTLSARFSAHVCLVYIYIYICQKKKRSFSLGNQRVACV